tara:strand:- start:581 stop:964 length:384 start_codon:yes stop_codon:yes gene_type:complete
MDPIHFCQTRNTDLASALYSVGVDFHHDEPFAYLRNHSTGKEFTQWHFQPESRDGEHRTAELIKGWHDPAWWEANREHPLSYVQAAMETRHALVDVIKKSSPRIIIKKHGKTYIVGEGSELYHRLTK